MGLYPVNAASVYSCYCGGAARKMTKMVDIHALDANRISVKLRDGETNAKVPRTPFNLESAIEALAGEALDLNGPESLYRITGAIAALYAADKGSEKGNTPIIDCATELLINMKLPENMPGSFVAIEVLSSLRDMELIDGGEIDDDIKVLTAA